MKVTSRIENDRVVQMPWAVSVAVAAQNRQNEMLYTASQTKLGSQLFDRVRSVFKASRVFRNYRENFIAVKVSDPKVKPTRDLSKFCKDNAITLHETSRGIIFRIKR